MEFGTAIVLLVTGALLFGGAAFRISTFLSLAPIVAGAVVVGFTTSFPEVVTASLATEHAAGALAYATLVGAHSSYDASIMTIAGGGAMAILAAGQRRFTRWTAAAMTVAWVAHAGFRAFR